MNIQQTHNIKCFQLILLTLISVFCTSCNIIGSRKDKSPMSTVSFLIGKDSAKVTGIFGPEYTQYAQPLSDNTVLNWAYPDFSAVIDNQGKIIDYYFDGKSLPSISPQPVPELVFEMDGMTCNGVTFDFGQTLDQWVKTFGAYDRKVVDIDNINPPCYVWDGLGIVVYEHHDKPVMNSIEIYFAEYFPWSIKGDPGHIWNDWDTDNLTRKRRYIESEPKYFFQGEISLFGVNVGASSAFRDNHRHMNDTLRWTSRNYSPHFLDFFIDGAGGADPNQASDHYSAEQYRNNNVYGYIVNMNSDNNYLNVRHVHVFQR